MKKPLINIYFVFRMLFMSNDFSRDRNTVYVYQDKGVSQESLKQTISTFQNLLSTPVVTTINARQVKEGGWTQNAILFVMPGGADVPYGQKLNGEGNEVIKHYVTTGGSFLGICAGSYYGSCHVEFDKNGPLEVLGDRELDFFKGTAIGPILAPYDDKTQSGSRAATLHTILPHAKKTMVFYNGGGFFENAEQYPNTNVIGTYDNHLPAIILIHYGRGKVLLSGVHFEYDPFLLNAKDQHIQKIIAALHQENASRKVLFGHLMELIGVK
jgi:glutamine amidotransferase-like uncharacterized protein